MSFPTIDRQQALRQLQLLGFESEDNVYLRFFYPSNDPRKEGDKGRKADRLNWKEIETHQRQGRGVYFVTNGGGHKNEDVTVGRAIFYEHDNLSKAIQRDLWQTLGLPDPTFQVDTGGKSIHSYWVFPEPIAVADWCELQKDLLEYADADRAIKNPARVMRLAGAWHLQIGENGKPKTHQSRLIADSGKKYGYEELRAIIPKFQADNALPLLSSSEAVSHQFDRNNNRLTPTVNLPQPSINGSHPLTDNNSTCPTATPHLPQHPAQIRVPVPASIPLLECCRKEVRDWVTSGVPKGSGRNSAAIEVGLELVAVERYLLDRGQPFCESSRQLFSEFCQRSLMSESEDEERWKWCEAKNPSPSCGSEGIEACIKGWYWREHIKPGKNPVFARSHQKSLIPNSSTVTGDSLRTSDTSKADLLSLSATVTTVTTLLKSGLRDYEERAELDAVQARSLMSKTAFWEMVSALRCELDEVQPEDSQRLNQLIDWHSATLDLHRVLPSLAEVFSHDAGILNIDPVSLWQYFLPTVLSLVGKRVNLDVESHRIPAIAWTCIVGESGTGKTRAEGVILGPLKQRQIEERQRWEHDWRDFQQTLRTASKDDPEPEPPTPERKYLFEVATLQALMRRLAEQRENGSLWARDELAGLFKSLGQFSTKSRGENEGLECLLKMWDGGAAFVERMDEARNSYIAEDTRLSIAGGIQPQAFRQAFKDPDDPQGLQARFLYAVPQVFPAKRVKGYCQLSDLLPALYDWLETLPIGTVKLSMEADRRYTHLVEQIGVQAESSPNPAIRAWMRKLPTQLLRIALALHAVECYGERQRPFWELQSDTLERAVEACRYYKSAFQVVQEKAADSDNISSILLKIWDLAVTQAEGLTPREVYRHIKALSRRANQLGRQVGAYTLELMSKLVEMGKGKLEKNGRTIRFFATFNPPPTPTSDLIPASPLKGVAEVTEGESLTEPALEVSATCEVSLVTVESTSRESLASAPPVVETQPWADSDISDLDELKEAEASVTDTGVSSLTTTNLERVEGEKASTDVIWLLQFLNELENISTPNSRLSSFEQVRQLWAEGEQRVNRCLDQLVAICADYFERLGLALEQASRLLSQ